MEESGKLPDLWDEALAGVMTPEERLVYRSNLLGSDVRITNFGGGNTSAKLKARDPLTGQAVDVLWVKGSGGDLGSISRDGFATLYLDRFLALRERYRGPADEDAMVALYPHCTFNLNPRAASIDTPLHGFVPYPHVDHVHPDAVIAIATSVDGEALTKEIWGGDIGWLPWRRPGFELGLWLERFVAENPHASGVVLGQHGLFTWGGTDRACYATTLDVINGAISWLDARSAGRAVFGGVAVPPAPPEARRAIAAAADAGLARPCFRRPVEDRPFRRPGFGARLRRGARPRSVSPQPAPPALIISCAQRSGHWYCPSIRRGRMQQR